jgi:hypothetical protein
MSTFEVHYHTCRDAAMKRRSSSKRRLMQRQPDLAGWSRSASPALSMCPVCWGDLTGIAHVDWCPHCLRDFRVGRRT